MCSLASETELFREFADELIGFDLLRGVIIGEDRFKRKYWYLGDLRLYRETLPVKAIKRKVSGKNLQSWEVVCATSHDWLAFTGELENSRNAEEKSLLRYVKQQLMESVLASLKRVEYQRRTGHGHHQPLKRSARIQQHLLQKKEEEEFLFLKKEEEKLARLQKAKEEKLLNKIMKLAGSQEDYEKWMAMLPLVDMERLRHEKEERTRLELLEKELKRLERAERLARRTQSLYFEGQGPTSLLPGRCSDPNGESDSQSTPPQTATIPQYCDLSVTKLP
ncbi:GRB10-interacting GYF protein 2-like [Zophobas morio]|uniref:GRB10-interacting GYF protein 2-like n=1 Tax=Zophobas morio TaxID=2755281 RepID=UPI003082884B